MAFNIVHLLENEFSNDVVEKVAAFIGEAPVQTRSALTNAVSAVIAALQQQASTPRGSTELFGALPRGGFEGASIESLAGLVGSPGGLANLVKTGGPLVAALFGSRLSAISTWLAGSAGIGKSGADSLLSLATPLVLNLVGRQASSTGSFNAASIAQLIKGQASALGANAPRGLAQALTDGAGGVARAGAAAAPVAIAGDQLEGGWLKWVLPVLAMLLLGVLSVWWYAYHAPVGVTAAPGAATAPAPAPTTPRVATAAAPTLAPAAVPTSVPAAGLVKRIVCVGQEIEVAQDGVESKLLTFLDDKTSVLSGNTWFSFDRLEFETDSAALKPSSRAQLRNLVEIMKCYPSLELKIGGYTDNTGDAAHNLKLSQERADSTKAELIALGVASSRLAAEGYGEQFPVAGNDTDEGRQRNRRTDVSITKK